MECGFHSRARFGRLHPQQESVKFTGQAFELDLGSTEESVVLFNCHEYRLGGAMLGDEHDIALDRSFQDTAKLILSLGRGYGCRLRPLGVRALNRIQVSLHNGYFSHSS